MKMIHRDTVMLLFPLTPEQRKALECAGYTEEDTSSWGKFYEALHDCPKCHLNAEEIAALRKENDTLTNWWNGVDARIKQIEECVKGAVDKVSQKLEAPAPSGEGPVRKGGTNQRPVTPPPPPPKGQGGAKIPTTLHPTHVHVEIEPSTTTLRNALDHMHTMSTVLNGAKVTATFNGREVEVSGAGTGKSVTWIGPVKNELEFNAEVALCPTEQQTQNPPEQPPQIIPATW